MHLQDYFVRHRIHIHKCVQWHCMKTAKIMTKNKNKNRSCHLGVISCSRNEKLFHHISHISARTLRDEKLKRLQQWQAEHKNCMNEYEKV